MRKPPPIRRIKPNHGSSGHPKHIIFFDTETITQGTRQVLQFGYAEEWKTSSHKGGPLEFKDDLTFTTVGEFWDWVETKPEKRRTLWVMAHNLGGFDAMVVETLGQLEARGFEASQVVIGTPPFIIQARRDTSTIKMVDSLNYHRTSLAALAKSVGMEKGEDPGGSIRDRLSYCQNDVAILRTAMVKYIELVKVNDWGTFALTLAGQAMNAWRHKYKEHEVVLNHMPDVVRLERASYHGGMVLDNHRGYHPDMYCVDENSMYVHIMAEHKFPIRMAGVSKHGQVEDIQAQRAKGWGHIAEVTLDTPNAWYPQKGERLLFPTGRFQTVLAGPELYRAIDNGHVVGVGRVQTYEMAPCLSRFAKDVYALRLEYQAAGDDAFATMTKTLGNSLYGKFGQRSAPWSDAPPGTPEMEGPTVVVDAETGARTTIRTILGRVEVRTPDDQRGEATNAMCAIASYVTSYARMSLLEGRTVAGEENAPYSDTDSMILNAEGLERLREAGMQDQSRLGAWKLERHGELLLRGPKDYIHGPKEKLKGIRLRSAERLGPGRWRQDQFVSMVGALQRGHRNEMHVLKVVKNISRECHKGMLHRNGKVTPPVMRDNVLLNPEICEGVLITYDGEFRYEDPCPHCAGLTWEPLAVDIDAPWLLDWSDATDRSGGIDDHR